VEDGVAVINPAGDCCRHACPARITPCKYCREPVRVLHQPPEAPERLAVVDAEPDPEAFVVLDEYGHAVVDRELRLPGPRYRWHTKHDRP
jgi:hypothetical protein